MTEQQIKAWELRREREIENAEKWPKFLSPAVYELSRKIGGTIYTPDGHAALMNDMKSLTLQEQIEFLLYQLGRKK